MQVEEGVDTKTIMQNYVVAKARLENAEKELRSLEKKYDRDVTNGNSRIKELEQKMRGMEEEIVGPLQEENKALEAELDNYRALYQ